MTNPPTPDPDRRPTSPHSTGGHAANAQPTQCRKCRHTITWTGDAWTVADTGTTADGLSYCPPNPDAGRVSTHAPRTGKRPRAPQQIGRRRR